MSTRTETIYTRHRLSKFIQFPLTKIVLANLFVIAGVLITQLIIGLFGTDITSPAISILSILIAVLVTYFSYRLYVQWIEERSLNEFSSDGVVKELVLGLLIGFGIVATIIGILWMLGSYQVSDFNSWLVLLPAAVANIPSGFVQEIIFRGILFRITEESLGTWIAMIISALLFGIIHAFSANATILSTLSIMLEAGVLLTAAYILTKRLWLAVGIHIAWDIAIDGFFGIGTSALSAESIHGLLQGRLVGNDLLTGGAQGVEASIIAVLVSLTVGCFLSWRAWRNNKFVPRKKVVER